MCKEALQSFHILRTCSRIPSFAKLTTITHVESLFQWCRLAQLTSVAVINIQGKSRLVWITPSLNKRAAIHYSDRPPFSTLVEKRGSQNLLRGVVRI